MATFRETLAKLFSRNLIVTRMPGDRLKIFDVNLSQMAERERSTFGKGRWRRNVTSTGLGYSSGIAEDIEAYRRTTYQDYEIMDRDAILASALDIYADESTVKDTNKNVLNIKTDDEKIKKLLYNLFYDVLNIEFNIFAWVRNTCKYGDYFLILDIRPNHGVVNVQPFHPLALQRIENPQTPGTVTFKFADDLGAQPVFGKDKRHLEEYEVAHFRLLTDTAYLPYGRSVLEPGRKTYKQLMLLEDAMMLQRIMRAPERRLFKIDIGNIAPEEVDGYIGEIADSMKKVPYIDERTGDYNLKFNIQNMLEDYFMPVRGSESGTSIETLPGLSGGDQLADIEYIKSKLLASIKIPKAWLGYDEGVDAKANLASMDVRFARTIERVQKMIVSELYKIAVIHLFVQGVSREKLLDFELELANPSIIFKRQQIDLIAEKMNLVTSMLDKRIFSKKYIYEQIFDMTEDEWKAMQDDVVEDQKEEFRLEQIVTEGNDPKVTGKSFGTPHDIASMQLSSNLDNTEDTKRMYSVDNKDGREDNEGRPEEIGTFETDRDETFGRDPLGRKGQDAKPSQSPTAGLAVDHLIRKLDSVKKTMLTERKDIDGVKGTLLDESRLLPDAE